jgi:hypothetical protein
MYFVDLAEAYHWLAVSAPKTGDRVGRAGDDRAKVMARRYDVGAPPSYDDDVSAAASAAASRNWACRSAARYTDVVISIFPSLVGLPERGDVWCAVIADAFGHNYFTWQ